MWAVEEKKKNPSLSRSAPFLSYCCYKSEKCVQKKGAVCQTEQVQLVSKDLYCSKMHDCLCGGHARGHHNYSIHRAWSNMRPWQPKIWELMIGYAKIVNHYIKVKAGWIWSMVNNKCSTKIFFYFIFFILILNILGQETHCLL